ncbi:MAG: hypothetical protein AAF997_00780 [Myxococcota bacterium]
MRGRQTVLGLWIAGSLTLTAVGACASSSEQSRSAPTTATSEGGSSRPPRGKIACRLHSCAAPYFCNEDTGTCQMLSCKQSSDCPYDYKCDFGLGVCR